MQLCFIETCPVCAQNDVPPPAVCRTLLSAPYRWAGILSDAYAIKVPLFKGYKEQAIIPFARGKVELRVWV